MQPPFSARARTDLDLGRCQGAPKLGAEVTEAGVRFGVFTTEAARCAVRLYAADGTLIATEPMALVADGYFALELAGVGAGQRYRFLLEERELTDPYARFLPEGVHGPAMVVSSAFAWRHGWGSARPLAEHVIYELHVGTFTPEGTYDAARGKLAGLARLGITAVELMPVAAFAGKRGWGYDGVAHYAPQADYGHPDALRRFIDEAHGHGLVVLMDVVYNHFGPAGGCLAAYSRRYLTRDFVTPWGEAPDFRVEQMRRYVVDNARYWIEEFRCDGLRLDATHAIVDPTPRHIVRELVDAVRELHPHALIIAEDERNDPALITELGCDAVWADDFHHQLRVSLTGEREGYYAAYEPGLPGLARVITKGFLYDGQRYPPTGRPRGKDAALLAAESFVYCAQNHDQIGNRALGSRLCQDVSTEAYCLASALLLFLPMTPLLFMGQEWASSSPFLYFTDHDAELGALVTAGRRREFASFAAFSDPARQAQIPDPQDPATHARSRLCWEEVNREPHARVFALYAALLELRRSDPVFRATRRRSELRVVAVGDVLIVERCAADGRRRVLGANFGAEAASLAALSAHGLGGTLLLATQAPAGDRLPPHAAVIFARDE